MKLKFFSVLFCFMCVGLHSQNIDTVYRKRHYNSIIYYQKYDVRMMSTDTEKSYYSLGNFKGGVKEGQWIFFYPSGQVFAKGRYSKGKKVGVWRFYDSGNKRKNYSVRYLKKWKATDKVTLDEYGSLRIFDVIHNSDSYTVIVNGCIYSGEPAAGATPFKKNTVRLPRRFSFFW